MPWKHINKERIEKFAARARAYICTYHHLEQEQQAVAENENLDAASVPAPKQQLLYTEIEWLQKAFTGHRCALDFDRGFVHSELKQAKT